MFFFKFIILLAVSFIIETLFAKTAFAWGPGVHTVTVLTTLNNASQLLPSIAGIITSFPREFLYGCLAADFFIGKGKIKKERHPHNWEGGFNFLKEAENDREASFAYGFLSHLAADVVAHNFFVPSLITSYPTGRKMGHLYWELKADYLIGPYYTKIAGHVLSMEHQECDELLNHIAGKLKNGIKVKKRFFTRSVKFSDYCYSTHDFFFAGKVIRRQAFHDYLVFMVDLSCRLVKDILRHPGSSPCLSYDPMGRESLLVRNKGLLSRRFNSHHPIRQFTVNKELLEL